MSSAMSAATDLMDASEVKSKEYDQAMWAVMSSVVARVLVAALRLVHVRAANILCRNGSFLQIFSLHQEEGRRFERRLECRLDRS